MKLLRTRLACAFLLACLGHAGRAAPHAAPPRHAVVVEAMQFSPARLEVNVGETVVWKNKDFFPHTATSSDRSFDSGAIASGASWTFRATSKGVHEYICTLHPGMKGVLVVK
ncbi:MAG: cupredoxin family copper-binding protein [Massilia sp.]